jgi:cell division protein FtsI (penicillin-binding protein 3)
VAAPVFARVAEQALRHLGVPPDDGNRVLRMMAYHPAAAAVPAAYHPAPAADRNEIADEPGLMPDLRGQAAREAAIAAARRGLVVELKGTGRVSEQSPAPGSEIGAGMTCVLTLERGQGVGGSR